jgi:hypothetical protein
LTRRVGLRVPPPVPAVYLLRDRRPARRCRGLAFCGALEQKAATAGMAAGTGATALATPAGLMISADGDFAPWRVSPRCAA